MGGPGRADRVWERPGKAADEAAWVAAGRTCARTRATWALPATWACSTAITSRLGWAASSGTSSRLPTGSGTGPCSPRPTTRQRSPILTSPPERLDHGYPVMVKTHTAIYTRVRRRICISPGGVLRHAGHLRAQGLISLLQAVRSLLTAGHRRADRVWPVHEHGRDGQTRRRGPRSTVPRGSRCSPP